MDPELIRLGVKLLETLHLNVPERQRLPADGVPLGALVTGVGARLDDTGWFPAAGLGEDDGWTGARLERRGRELWVHERQEVGATRLGPIRSRRVGSLEQAIRLLVEASRGSPIDGVRIDWSG